MADTPEILDPERSMTDLAKLMARLGEPFAKPDEVLASAQVTQGALDAARLKWSRDLKGNDMLKRLYGELFYRERARLRGEPERVSAKAAPTAASVDETAIAPLVLYSGPALPFVDGKFEPELQPVEPRQERPFDADATLPIPGDGDGDALPFAQPLRSREPEKP